MRKLFRVGVVKEKQQTTPTLCKETLIIYANISTEYFKDRYLMRADVLHVKAQTFSDFIFNTV